jgi:hypothetical protein
VRFSRITFAAAIAGDRSGGMSCADRRCACFLLVGLIVVFVDRRENRFYFSHFDPTFLPAAPPPPLFWVVGVCVAVPRMWCSRVIRVIRVIMV